MRDIFKFTQLQEHFGLPDDFFEKLPEEDDWSFVIKLHALFEGISSHLLSHYFKEPNLSGILSKIELSNKATGKIAFLHCLKLISDDNRRLIYKLSEIRNSLVHDVRNSKFNLKEMISKFDDNKKKQFAIAFSPYESFMRKFPYREGYNSGLGFKEEDLKDASIEAMINCAIKTPKQHIWYGSYNVLINLWDQYEISDIIHIEKGWRKSDDEIL